MNILLQYSRILSYSIGLLKCLKNSQYFRFFMKQLSSMIDTQGNILARTEAIWYAKDKKWRILVLSTIATSFLALQTAEAATYTVQKGDTLSKIAQHHQVTIEDIMKWNNLSKDTIFVAQKLEIQKQTTSEGTKLSTPSTSVKPTAGSHTVAKGDTLSKIAKQYNVSIKDIQEWNKLEKDIIYIGQVLKISSGAVKPGVNLYIIM